MHIQDYLDQTNKNVEEHATYMFDCAKDYQQVEATDSGRRMINDLNAKFNHESSYYPGIKFPETAYYEGQRSVINYLTHQLNFKPQLKNK